MTEGQTTSHIDAQLAEGGQITGQVTNPAGQGLAGVSVQASDDKSNSGYASTNSNGDYLLQGMPAGSYKIKFDAGNQNFAIEWYSGKKSRSLADPVQVTLGTPTTGIDAQLAVGGKICGMVTTPVGADLQALVAKAYDMNNTDVGSTFVNNNGDFCIQGLPGGSYKIQFRDIHEHTQVQCGQTVLAQAWYDQKTTFEQADPVQVTVDTTSNINTQLYFGGGISGKTTIPSSAPLNNVHVWVYDSNQHRVIDGRSGTDGKYQIDGIPAGSYRVFFDPTASFGPIWYQQKNAFGLADPVSVTASALTPNIDGQCWYQLYLPLLSNN